VRLLLKAGATVNLKDDKYCRMLLSWAARDGREAARRYIISCLDLSFKKGLGDNVNI